MLTIGEIEVALSSSYEVRGFEVKGPGGRSDKQLFAQVARAAMGIANLRDGGHVIIGIDDSNLASMFPGLNNSELNSWLAYDDVARKLSEYADPPIRFDVQARTLSNNATVATIQVHEFDDIPILCKRDYPDTLRAGACYVRPRRVPETSEIPTSTDMRDLLDLATQKALRRYVERSERAGITLSSSGSKPTSEDQFRLQREEGW